ncbi:tryptophan halogenase family protein [Paraglaciecola sp. L3A3]|uniref:tryptophan halogenase family protein n=1 Tax=Paraglaciecola sp. L3A3 TaxID=2686358 RepID=UPI00131E1B76|nr:tryptophan halogenase family protein [Paraglaciecola sp. L3A3]
MQENITKVVIAGGGTAGWMTAVAMSRLIKNTQVVLIESDEIATVGVGEATIPTLQFFHEILNINEAELLKATGGTFKLGISFENWKTKEHKYFHAFGETGKGCWAADFQHFWLRGKKLGLKHEFGDFCVEQVAAQMDKFARVKNKGINYAYHIDATKYAAYLRTLCEKNTSFSRVEGKIASVDLLQNSGEIGSLTLESGQKFEGDLFIDCTGQRALLIGEALNTPFEDWSHWLVNDSAIAVQTKSTESPKPYTRSIAHDSGWQWKIPLQHRVGNGIIYSSKFMSDTDAEKHLLNNIEGETLTSPRKIAFKTGTRKLHWNKNCVAIGLSSGFLEPLESTSIHLIQQSIIRLLKLFPVNGLRQVDINEFNQQTAVDIDSIRDFIILHYVVTERKDSPYWQYQQEMQLPDSLKHRIELFKQSGHVCLKNDELFEDSWMQVMIGQGLIPQNYHPIVDNMSDNELFKFLNDMRELEYKRASSLPSHQKFIDLYCAAKN